ncbi:ATP-binding protein [Photobacterium swingsii]|uniref:ATP-binding protein n=1 Tax=Photobacterium swingsii TaxID=680026 RepID=UPI000AE3B8BC|nr:ATP-binding protein [Photobacterium swingsii]
MHIKALRIQNFRRLKDVTIELDRDLSIFVGANNSGKTSTGHALQLFTAASKDKFTVHDFNIDSWNNIEVGGNIREATPPTISLDIWLQVNEENLHRIIELLPSLQWEGNYVGIRIKFSPIDIRSLLVRYQEAKAEARSNALTNEAGEITFQPQPKNLKEFLEQNLKKEYELKYYVLDHSKFNEEFNETEDYEPELISREKGKSGKELINSLIKVDFLHAQRHLSDNSEGNRSEELSKRLSRFYERNLEKLEDDYETIEALSTSESKLNDHLAKVFEPTLDSLSHLGYPGLSNPNLVIKSSLNPTTILSNNDGAKVYYSLDTEDDRCSHILPDRYNGLGYKNLIYMVIELLDIHTQWLDIEESRPALHLIFIEEPEAHLHVQLQQAFIRKVMDLLALDHSDTHLQTQLVVTTHSTHILYEKGLFQ